MDKCKNIGKYLQCKIYKAQLEEILYQKESQFLLVSTNEEMGISPIYYPFYITINHSNIKKEDIHVEITKLLEKNYERNNFIAYETNVTNISDITTKVFEIKSYNNYYDCFFKKVRRNNLLLLCEAYPQGNYSLEITDEILFSNIHVKYDFIIEPTNNTEMFYVNGYGASVFISYPFSLNFKEQNSFIIEFLMINPKYEIGIKLNQEGKELECTNSRYIKRCVVPKSHFEYQKSGFYYYSYLNNFGEQNIHYELTPIQVILPEEKELILSIQEEDNGYLRTIGLNGTISFITNYTDDMNIFDISDIESNTSFEATLIDDEGNKYDAKCRLWKPKKENIRIFCKPNEIMFYEFNYINFDNIIHFRYKDYIITIISELDGIPVEQTKEPIPFLYSDIQQINANKYQDSYELTFKIESYNNELLDLYRGFTELILDNCKISNSEIKCKITLEMIEEILAHNEDTFYLGALSDYYGFIRLDQILSININYTNITKEDIYVGVTGLNKNYGDKNNIIAYNTNISSIQNVITTNFILPFNMTNIYCLFKKAKGSNLLLLCQFYEEGNYSLNEITEERIEDDINIKYNFRIQPVLINETIIINEKEGNFIFINHPLTLDFTDKSSIIIRYSMYMLTGEFNIRLNPYSEDINCEVLFDLAKCIIPLNHFNNATDGYYNTYYRNDLGQLSIYYDASPFYVILPEKGIELQILDEDNKEEINVGQKGTLYFITNYDDSKYNIFDGSDIEQKTIFINTVEDEYQNKYNVTCRLWKPKNEKIRVICNMDDNLLYSISKIKFNSVKFIYNKMTIEIYSDIFIKINQINYEIPFIYSDYQEINIIEGKDKYDLKFKYDTYNNEILYLDSYYFRASVIDNCEVDEKEKTIICHLTREKIESFVPFEHDTFELGCINKTFGSISFISAFEITINYCLNITKEDIYVGITKLLDNTTEIYGHYAYETNISDIPNLSSGIFYLPKNDTRIFNYFKKTNANKNMLLLCLPMEMGEYSLGQLNEEYVIYDVHYKYNFRIQPVINKETISVETNGAFIELVYPEILNFTSEEELNIYYLTPLTMHSYFIKLNPNSYYLDCENLLGVKKCTVYYNHFEGKESGYYNTYHLNHKGDLAIYYDANPIKVILPIPEKKVEISVNYYTSMEIGLNGTLYMITDYNDTEANIFNISDIEDKTSFGTIIYDDYGNYYYTKCRLWKPKEANIRIFCDINDKLKKEVQEIRFNSTTFEYNDYKVYIKFNNQITLTQYNVSIPFLYSDKQNINIEDGKEVYNIKFKTENYNNEKLIFIREAINNLFLDECEIENRELICKIYKTKLEEIMPKNRVRYYINAYSSVGIIKFDNILEILVTYYNITKEDVDIGINRLLSNVYGEMDFVVYETNISNISNVVSDIFDLKTSSFESECFFKKSENKNLLLLCILENEGNYSLGYINEVINKTDISIKYNFYIQPFNNTEEYIVRGQSSFIFLANPTVLDFNSNDSLNIDFIVRYPEYIKIKLNPDADELDCIDRDIFKRCFVTEKHFEGKKSGYYDVIHSDTLNDTIISYELSPIKVILPYNINN